MFAFEPTTLALGAALFEKAVQRPSRACCIARILLRRAPDILVDETAEPLLEALGTTMYHQAVDALLISLGMTLLFLVFRGHLRLMPRD
jgi:hypothetical protein